MTNLMRASLRTALATTILAGGALALAMPASAQTTSTIQGHVDGAAAGATVVLTDTNTGHQDTVKVDANGVPVHLRDIAQDPTVNSAEAKRRLSIYRKAREKARQRVEEAGRDLKELLSQRQEGLLVMLGILE